MFTQCSVILYSRLSTGQPPCLGGPVASVAVRYGGVRPFYISCQSLARICRGPMASLALLSTIFFLSTIHRCLRLDCLLPDAPTASLFQCLQCTVLHQFVVSCLPLSLDAPAVSLFLCFTVSFIVLHQCVNPSLSALLLLQSRYFCASQCRSLYLTSV